MRLLAFSGDVAVCLELIDLIDAPLLASARDDDVSGVVVGGCLSSHT